MGAVGIAGTTRGPVENIEGLDRAPDTDWSDRQTWSEYTYAEVLVVCLVGQALTEKSLNPPL